MKRKKIRGHKRRWRSVERQVDMLKLPDTLFFMGKAHADIYIGFRGYRFLSYDRIREPKGNTRMKILSRLLEIYESWKIQLDMTGQPYYLKIWLFDPRFSMSRVVCALGDQMEFCETMFSKPAGTSILNSGKYGRLKQCIDRFDWEAGVDEDHFADNEPGLSGSCTSRKNYEKAKKRFDRLLRKSHRVSDVSDQQGEVTKLYSFTRGMVWIGELRQDEL